MQKRWRLLLLLFLICLLILVLFVYIKNHRNSNTLTLFGNVDVRQVALSFRVPGQVTELLCEEGDFVTHGTLLARLDRAPYNSQVQQAEAQLQAAETSLKNAKMLFERRKSLIGDHNVSQEDLDNASTNYEKIVSDHAAAKAALVIAKENLSYTELFAPTDGIILTRIREPGTVVNPTDSIFNLSLRHPIWIRAYVSEPHLGQIYYGMKALIATDTKGAPKYQGRIGFISPVAEFTPKTVQTTELRTDLVYRIRIYIDQADDFLKQGMPVTVTIHESD